MKRKLNKQRYNLFLTETSAYANTSNTFAKATADKTADRQRRRVY